ALLLYLEMESQSGVEPDIIACNAVLNACAKAGRWSVALALLRQKAKDIGADAISYGAAISACARGETPPWELALALLREASADGVELDVVAWSAAISVCEKSGRWEQALCLLPQMREQRLKPDLIVYSAAVRACARGGCWMPALALLGLMKDQALHPNIISFGAALSACAAGGRWDHALELLSELRAAGLKENLITCNAAMSACEKGGEWRWCLVLLEGMRSNGPAPDRITSELVAVACRRALGWSMALSVLEDLRQDGISLPPDALETVLGRSFGPKACADWGCQCGRQSLRYPFKVSKDYHNKHPVVWELAKWRASEGSQPPEVYQTASQVGYRTRGKMAVGPNTDADAPEGSSVIGLFRQGCWQVTPSSQCKANHPALAAGLQELQIALDHFRTVVLPFDHDADDSKHDTAPALRYVELTLERGSGLVQLVLVWNGERGSPAPALQSLVDYLWAGQAGSEESGPRRWHSIWIHWRDPDPALLKAIHSKRPDAWEQVRPPPTTSNDVALNDNNNSTNNNINDVGATVLETLDGLTFSFGPASFQQANLGIFEQILADMKVTLKRLAAPEGPLQLSLESRPLRLLELCGGVGVIGISLAHAAASWDIGTHCTPRVALVSSDVNSNCARLFDENARRVFPDLTGRAQIKFCAVSADEALSKFFGSDTEILGGTPDVLIMDPPRRGLAQHRWRTKLVGGEEEATRIRLCEGLRCVIYMSCGYDSFMVDAERLTESSGQGPAFRLVELKCYDMFPFTAHIETVGIFIR
ncbi:unnamed protein product, partial [Polarella glacialis]